MRQITLALLLTLSACSHYPITETPEPSASPSPGPVSSPSPAPQPALGKIEFIPDPDYTTPEERIKIKRVGELADQLRGTQCAKDWISKRALIDTGGKTPAQVADHLASLSGKIPVKVYYRCMRTWRCPTGTTAVAYREGDTIYLNRAAFWPEQPDSEWLGTQLHEGLGHLLGGYDHSYDWTPTRDYSVPYSLGGSTEAHGGDLVSACLK